MNTLIRLEVFVDRITWTLCHSLWQFAVVAVGLALVLTALRRASPNARYLAACAAMVLLVASAPTTFWLLGDSPREVVAANHQTGAVPSAGVAPRPVVESKADTALPSMNSHPHKESATLAAVARRSESMQSETETNSPLATLVTKHEAWIVSVWLVGMCVFGMWHFGGWVALTKLSRTGVSDPDPHLRDRFERLRRQTNCSQAVRILESMLVDVPVVIGWWRPIVLVPASMVTGLSTSQLDAILAHELAHIRRHDYLINLLQSVAETLLFYHPGVWWISRQIRVQREYCCDEVASATSGSPLDVARALAAMEEKRSTRLALAMSGTNRSGETANRIRRLLGEQPRSCQGLRALISSMILAACASGTLLSISASAADQTEAKKRRKTLSEFAPKTIAGKPADAKQGKRPEQSIEELHRDLALYYTFDDDDDEVVRDSSGNDLNGQTVGAVGYQPSFRGKAAKFSNNKTYILCDDLCMDRWPSLTVSAWINTNRITNHAQIFSCGEVTGEEMSGFVMQVGGTSKACWNVVTEYQGRSRQGQSVYTSSLLASRMKRVGKWVHVTGVFDGTFVKFYINGKLDCQNEVANAAPIIFNPKSHKLVIGNTANKSRMTWVDKYFDGLVDEVKIWKRGLTPEEIEGTYQTGADQIARSALQSRFHGKDVHRPVAALASSVWKDAGPENFFDADVETFWSSGGPAPAWIELDLGKRVQIGQIDLLCSPSTTAETIHHVWVSDQPIAGDRRNAKRIHTFRGQTGPFHPLSVRTNPKTKGRFVQIQTDSSKHSGWVAWSEIAIRRRANKNRQQSVASADQPATQVKFDGLAWDAFRTKFAVQDQKLVTLPQARPGFHYGHGGNGRGALIATHTDDESWTDYQLEFDFSMNSCEPKFNPYGLAKDHRGMTIYFRTQGLPESWNEKGHTSYTFSMNSEGGWNLDRWDDYYCAGTGFKSNYEGKLTRFDHGKSDAIAESTQPGHANIIVQGNRLRVSVNDDLIVDFKDTSESPLLHGGVGFMWRYETMGWLDNVKVTRLPANPGEVPVDLSKPATKRAEYPYYMQRAPLDFFSDSSDE